MSRETDEARELVQLVRSGRLSSYISQAMQLADVVESWAAKVDSYDGVSRSLDGALEEVDRLRAQLAPCQNCLDCEAWADSLNFKLTKMVREYEHLRRLGLALNERIVQDKNGWGFTRQGDVGEIVRAFRNGLSENE